MSTVLITCAGTGVGQSILDSLTTSGEYRLIGCDLNRNIYAYNQCHNFYVAPNIYDNIYVDFILDVCSREKVDIVIPGHDYELILFSKNIHIFEDNGIEVLVSLADLIEISRNKFLWYKYFSERGCSIVPTVTVSEFKAKPDDSFFPAIVKPAGGSASQGIQIISRINDLVNAKDSDIIQPYLFPTKKDKNYEAILNAAEEGRFVQLSEISIQLVFTRESEFAGIFISKNILKNGVPVFVDPIEPEKFEYIDEIYKFIPILIENKVKGPVNIQGRITEKGLVFFEMNMRFTGITGNRAQLGFNEVAFLVNNFLGLPAKLEGYSLNKLGTRQVACTTIPRSKADNPALPTYLILGGSGFIGSYFIHELIKTNSCKEIFLICGNEKMERYYELYSSYPNIHILKYTDLLVDSKYSISDVFVNFASALADAKDIYMYDSIHFQYNQSRKVAKAKIPLVINISSQSVYDQTSDIMKDENSKLDIDNLYSFQKNISEEFFSSNHFDNPAIKVISLRFARVIGTHIDGRKSGGFFSNMINSLVNDKQIYIPNPMNKTNLLDVRDAVGSVIQVINHENRESLPSVINIGGTNLSIKKYCQIVLECLALQSNKNLIKFSNSKEVVTSSMVNTDLAKDYGWSNKYFVEDTIKDIYKYLPK